MSMPDDERERGRGVWQAVGPRRAALTLMPNRWRRRPPPLEAGTIIVGDNVLVADDNDLTTSSSPHAQAVDAEGTAPAAPTDAPLAAASAWLFRPGAEPALIAPDDIPAALAIDENFVWVDLSAYAQADLREIGRLLDLHRRAVHAALSPWQRPRLAIYPNHFYTSATVARPDATTRRVQASELDLFVGRNFLVSAHKQPLPFGDHLLTRARTSPELVLLDAAFMLYVILDELLAYYEELNTQMQGEIERMEERALRDTSDQFLEDLVHFKRYVFALDQLAEQHRAVFAAYLRPDFTLIAGQEVEAFYEDLDTRLARLLGMLSGNRETVNGSFEIYVSQMAHRTNAIIRTLTVVSTLLFSASVLISLFGASVQGLATYAPFTFIGMLVAILVVCAIALWLFRTRKWV